MCDDLVGKYPFQFTHPGKGATIPLLGPAGAVLAFQFTHPGKGATASRLMTSGDWQVSIHAPWEGCDHSV